MGGAAADLQAPPHLHRPSPPPPSIFPRPVDSLLFRRTPLFGVRVWIVALVGIAALTALLLFIFSVCVIRFHRRCSRRQLSKQRGHGLIPTTKTPQQPLSKESEGAAANVKEEKLSALHDSASTSTTPPDMSQLGWGQWYTLREVEAATGGLAKENVIGEGGYGIVYRGVLADGTAVAIKNLLNNRGQAEKEFRVEVEAIGRVRHKNLVKLLGYCVDGDHRMLVYEFVDNGNLEQWLHGDVGGASPLTWDTRMAIMLGTAKGLAYLHEGLEPKVVHRDIKSSNILLDRQWNPKVSDFGLAKLLCSERSHVTTRVMGTFGYVAPEYASSGLLNERSDVYSFGVLLMEIITGRQPVDYTQPRSEVHLVEWLKIMVSKRRGEELVDPKLPQKPSSRAFKKALLIALRCVDPDGNRRPKMGHVVHMLEMDDMLLLDSSRLNDDKGSFSFRKDNQLLVAGCK